MIRFDAPVMMPGFVDEFDDGVRGDRWVTLINDGLTTEAGGLAKMALSAGAGYRGEGYGVFRYADVRRAYAVIHDYLFDDPLAAGRTISMGMAADFTGIDYDAITLESDGAGPQLSGKSYRGGVLVDSFSVVAPAAPFEIYMTRHGAECVMGYVDSLGQDVELLTVADCTTAPVGFSAQIESTGAGASWVELDSFGVDIEPIYVDEISDDIFGIHLAPTLTVRGAGFDQYMEVLIDTDAVDILSATAVEAELGLPNYDTPALRTLIIRYPDAFDSIEIPLQWRDRGLTALLQYAGDEAYSDDWTNARNVELALRGQGLDRLDGSFEGIIDEIFPETAGLATMEWHEEHYSISVKPQDDIEQRRARVLAARRKQPRIDHEYLKGILAEYLGYSPVTINEMLDAPFTYYNVVAVDPTVEAPQMLAALREMEDIGPGHTPWQIGYAGFIVGQSMLGRDMLGEPA